MTLKEILEEELLLTEKQLSKRKKMLKVKKKERQKLRAKKREERLHPASNKKPKITAEGNRDKIGRKRLVTNVYHRIIERGGSASKEEIKNYIVHIYKMWEERNPKVKWILRLEKRAKRMGFDPRYYNNKPAGTASGGIGNPGGREYQGRAFFFVSFVNNLAVHFMKKYNKKEKRNEL